MPFAYASNVKAYLGSLRNLPLALDTFDKSDISGAVYLTLDRPLQKYIRRPESQAPSQY